MFEKCSEIESVFFDKTGTLTESDLALVESRDSTTGVYQKIILALENESLHPIAFSFRQAFLNPGYLPPVDGFAEVPGKGVSGFVYGKFYELKRNAKPGSEVGCTLFEEHMPVQTFTFRAKIKPDVRATMDKLRAAGKRVFLLSGDSQSVSQTVGEALGFAPSEIKAEATPEVKLAAIKAEPRSMMVGDGVNDSLAIMASSVGVAVSGGMETALKSADVYLSENGLNGVAALFEISDSTLKLIKRNLRISLAYNFIGGVLALCGFY